MKNISDDYIGELDVTEDFVDSLAKMLEICLKNNTSKVNLELDVGDRTLNVEVNFTLQ
ncbi:MAG: hypothetical protein IJZ79_03055 [Bacilli bacterium]|nr:hypothetical protein [Bacilli bacterium]MBQ8218705.1 hypothetical protein [Bacilli bacterium]